jgi:acetoin utilization protein AcuB
MLVKERMSHPVITVHPDLPMQEALKLMRTEHIRRLPVVDRLGQLVGIVSERDLLHAAPSSATSLSIWEIHYLLSQITVEKIMAREVVTIHEETPLEEAARIMADRKIGGLPVVRDGEVVGMVTETDLFRVFLEMLGAREPGIRITALVPNVPGELARLTQAVFQAGGNILALGTFLGESAEDREVMIKVEGASAEVLRQAIAPVVKRAIDVREVAAA